MMCYRDRWFCPFFRDCARAKECDRPLTDEVIAAARATGMEDYIDQPTEPPVCHDPIPPTKPTER